MLAIVLLALGIPVWLAIGALGAGLWSRRDFRSEPGVFSMKFRSVTTNEPAGWSRRLADARWVHDVLIIRQGFGFVRHREVGVRAALSLPLSAAHVAGLGDSPVGMRVEADDGASLDVAAAASDRALLVGPFGDRLGEPSA